MNEGTNVPKTSTVLFTVTDTGNVNYKVEGHLACEGELISGEYPDSDDPNDLVEEIAEKVSENQSFEIEEYYLIEVDAETGETSFDLVWNEVESGGGELDEVETPKDDRPKPEPKYKSKPKESKTKTKKEKAPPKPKVPTKPPATKEEAEVQINRFFEIILPHGLKVGKFKDLQRAYINRTDWYAAISYQTRGGYWLLTFCGADPVDFPECTPKKGHKGRNNLTIPFADPKAEELLKKFLNIKAPIAAQENKEEAAE